MAPPPPELNDDVATEILLRLPPEEPEHLFRASLVCKPWLRILRDPAFLRRYRAFHGTPPLLGFLHRLRVIQGEPTPRLATTTSAPLFPYPDLRRSRALDCRHGRVLLHVLDATEDFLVWDPLTGDQHRLPDLDVQWLVYSAAVICAVGGCDHLDCHGGPFLVTFVFTHDFKDVIQAAVYSSETGAWSTLASLHKDCLGAIMMEYAAFFPPYVQPRRGTVIGEEFYFTLRDSNAIIKYDWGKNTLSLIHPPSPNVYGDGIALMVMEDNSLGFACTEGSGLYLWSRKVDSDGAAQWVQCRVIELEKMIPGDEACVVGAAEGVGVIFVSMGAVLFTVELKSGRVRKVDDDGAYFSVLPYMSFYTPDHAKSSSIARTH